MDFITYTIEVTSSPRQKSGYKAKWAGLTYGQSRVYWNGLNIGNGYKARMRECPTGKIVARKA